MRALFLLSGLLAISIDRIRAWTLPSRIRGGVTLSAESSASNEARIRTRDMLLSGRRGGQASLIPSSPTSREPVGVLFDFDGTLGDTETPAMQVAYWELAPFFPQAQGCDAYVQDNAGRPFEAMLEDCDQARKDCGLPPVEKVRLEVAAELPEDKLAAIDGARAKFGLAPLADAVSNYGNLPEMQKEETVKALSSTATATLHCIPMLDALDAMDNVRFCIATTSPKPRVPVCVDAADLRSYFSPESIHSGESDFDPPRFKPDPSVYVKAAEWVGIAPGWCVAVEDSASGVGSASNAGIGLIVGYVGASHIAPSLKESHAAMLMKGTKADSGRGAAVVIEDLADLPKIVEYFQEKASHAGGSGVCWGIEYGERLKELCSKGNAYAST